MDKHLVDSQQNLRIARTLGIAVEEDRSSTLNNKARAPDNLDHGLAVWKEAARKEIDAELAKKYEVMYSKKLKELNEKEEFYKNACISVTGLLESLQKVSQESLSLYLKDLNSITIMLVLESLYKIIGDDEKYKEYVARIVEDSINSLGESIAVTASISLHDYKLLINEPMFIKFKSFIHPDEKLTKGQFLLDDGTTTYAVGILDRLDVLRSAFLNAVGQT